MFIAPTAQEARKGEPPMIRVETTSGVRLEVKPDRDEVAFEEAAELAVAEALENGFRTVAFDSVQEFIAAETDTYRIAAHPGETLREVKHTRLTYEYVWMFTAWDPIEGDA